MVSSKELGGTIVKAFESFVNRQPIIKSLVSMPPNKAHQGIVKAGTLIVSVPQYTLRAALLGLNVEYSGSRHIGRERTRQGFADRHGQGIVKAS
jgi:hypothetical protein